MIQFMKKFSIIILIIFIMAETWGMEAKSAIDPETIEEAIARLIAVHEADSSSHLGSGESLEAHKSADVIDHPAYSVVADKISIQQYIVDTYFTANDGFSTLGLFQSWTGYCELLTGATTPTTSYFYLPGDTANTYASDVSKNPSGQFSAIFNRSTNGTIRFGIGYNDDNEGVDSLIGFKQDSTGFYGIYYTVDGTLHTVSISPVTFTDLHIYRVDVVTGDCINWYIDGVLVATVDISAITLANGRGYVFFGEVSKGAGTPTPWLSFFHIRFVQDF
jgi:hypothetical protein